MALQRPTTLSPSKVTSFRDCALAFRFSAIDRLPDPPTTATVRGTLVHSALERLFQAEPAERDEARALTCLAEAAEDMRGPDGEITALDLSADDDRQLLDDAERLVHNYFALEDPRTIRPIGLELRMQVELDDLRLVGIIDRLELDDDGELVVTDYKTGRAPSDRYEQSKMGGIHFYSLLCEELLGRRPARIQLLHLHDPVAIIATPTDQSTRGLRVRVGAIWQAIGRACEHEDFRPRPGPLCSWCAYQRWCPQFGGDPDRAAVEAAAAAEAEATPVDPPRLVAAGSGANPASS